MLREVGITRLALRRTDAGGGLWIPINKAICMDWLRLYHQIVPLLITGS